MFTGIITDIGEITAIDKNGDWVVAVKVRTLPLDFMTLGASVSCSGVCLTVMEMAPQTFKVQVSMETLSKTTAVHWQIGSHINLETAVRAGDELGGHMVSGHVDGVGRVVERTPVEDSLRFLFEVPRAFAKFLAPKGSVTIDGVSLTLNEVNGAQFSINVIPHTQSKTILGALKRGDEVNFEVDMIARYVERMLSNRAA